MQATFTLGGIPGHPAMGTLPRDTHRLGHMRDRHPGLDPSDQQPPAMERQTSITVGHEDLRTVGDLDITHRTRRSSLRQRTRRSVTNVLAEYT
jgi:transposase-like protein